ncbi:hypothetical protein [Saliniramus sp.]|uniref:hypothetical protein n=1 Tax=Saliniramus sp. TaxID=2986772 RepID=UPI002CDAFC32|nr:hypothetical protein [Saliniramus sp.]HMB11837.1 hypothetical protein [Saliniramus sp.]
MIVRHATRSSLVRNRILASAAPLFAMLLAILASTVLFAPVHATAQPRDSVSAITVDVAPLRARGVGVFADLLHDSLRAELQARYTIAANAPRLHVTLNSFFLNANTWIDHDDSFGGGFAQPPLDNLGGEAQLIAPDGRVIDSYSLLANNPATTGSHRPSPEREQIRAMALTRVFAGWVVRRF